MAPAEQSGICLLCAELAAHWVCLCSPLALLVVCLVHLYACQHAILRDHVNHGVAPGHQTGLRVQDHTTDVPTGPNDAKHMACLG